MFSVNTPKYSLAVLVALLLSALSQANFLDKQLYSSTEPYSKIVFEDIFSDSDTDPENNFDSSPTLHDKSLSLSDSRFSSEIFFANLSLILKNDISLFIDVRGPPPSSFS